MLLEMVILVGSMNSVAAGCDTQEHQHHPSRQSDWWHVRHEQGSGHAGGMGNGWHCCTTHVQQSTQPAGAISEEAPATDRMSVPPARNKHRGEVGLPSSLLSSGAA